MSGRGRFDFDRLDAGARRAAPQFELDAIDCLLVPLDDRLDAAIRQVPDNAVHAFPRRGASVSPEADACHARDQYLLSHSHALPRQYFHDTTGRDDQNTRRIALPPAKGRWRYGRA